MGAEGILGLAVVVPQWVALVWVGLVVAMVGGFGIGLVRLRRRLREVAEERDAIEGGERRMFYFLHALGIMIEEDCRPRKLYKVIVEGVEEVLGADGGALYLLNEEGSYLVPSYLSEGCPPLAVVPEKIWKREAKEGGALMSYLRLAKVPVGAGVLGHCVQKPASFRVASLKEHESFGEVDRARLRGVPAMLVPVCYAGKPIGVLALVREAGRAVFTTNEFDLFCSVAEQSAFALGNALVHMEASAKRKMDRQMRVAADVQKVLLPAEEPQLPGYRVHGMNVPAQLISGDYYDYISLEGDELGVAIADVSGKGVSAGLMMATCRSALRAAAIRTRSPAEALAVVNRQLFPDMREDMFISLAYLILESGSGRMRMARAGHDAPLMFRRASGEIEVLRPGGLALGVDEGPVFERVTRDFETAFEAGDCLLLYTDGVNEAENKAGEEFGRERLHEAFREAAPQGSEAAVEALRDSLGRFVGGNRQMDDITLIVIERR